MAIAMSAHHPQNEKDVAPVEYRKLVSDIPGFRRPRIYQRIAQSLDTQRETTLAEEKDIKYRRVSRVTPGATPSPVKHVANTALDSAGKLVSGKLKSVTKQRNTVTGRTFTSRFRGVHQTFPTKRWEAQFRRGGKPTSLGCFDAEEQAARAYDKMMIWCHLHQEVSAKHGITNYDMKEYEPEFNWLISISQEDLIESLRCDGRKQAATRQLRQKQNSGAFITNNQRDDKKPDKKSSV